MKTTASDRFWTESTIMYPNQADLAWKKRKTNTFTKMQDNSFPTLW